MTTEEGDTVYHFDQDVKRNNQPRRVFNAAIAAIVFLCIACTEERQVLETDTWQQCDAEGDFFGVASDGDDCNFEGSCAFGEFCTLEGGLCFDGKLAVSTLEVEDCQFNGEASPVPEPRPGMSWDVCEAALVEGQTGEPCSLAEESWACGRPNETDDCCQDIAFCKGNDSTQPGVLVRLTACAMDCRANAVDLSRNVVNDCAEAATARPGDPCSGHFSCIAQNSFGLEGRWCGDGVLRVLGAPGILPAVVMELVP